MQITKAFLIQRFGLYWSRSLLPAVDYSHIYFSLTNSDIPDIPVYYSCLESRVVFAVGNSSCHGRCVRVLRRLKSKLGSPNPQSTPLSGDLIRDRRNRPSWSYSLLITSIDNVSFDLHYSGGQYVNVAPSSSKLPRKTKALIEVTNLGWPQRNDCICVL
jgi:hypothetical protein